MPSTVLVNLCISCETYSSPVRSYYIYFTKKESETERDCRQTVSKQYEEKNKIL